MCGIVGHRRQGFGSDHHGFRCAGWNIAAMTRPVSPSAMRTARSPVGRPMGDSVGLRLANGEALAGTTGIGHTRWTTHGRPSDANAHPHMG
jgi:glucosamine--fructose-6-phosphate aminotransferase (isomerizing)